MLLGARFRSLGDDGTRCCAAETPAGERGTTRRTSSRTAMVSHRARMASASPDAGRSWRASTEGPAGKGGGWVRCWPVVVALGVRGERAVH